LKKQGKGAGEAKKILDEKLPVEITDKIIKEVTDDLFVKKIAMQVVKLLSNSEYQSGIDVRNDVRAGIYPLLPTEKTIPMDKHLVQRLRTSGPCDPVRVDGNTMNSVTWVLEENCSINDGFSIAKDPIVKVNPIKETAQVVTKQEEPTKMTKSAKRRLRAKRAAEKKPGEETNQGEDHIVATVDSAVHLNSRAPAMSGAPTTSGTKKPSPSQRNLKKSERVTSFSQVQEREKKPQSGKKPARDNQNMRHIPGHPAVLKRKNGASNSNVTDTLQSAKSQPMAQ
jgi:hypothetical protein